MSQKSVLITGSARCQQPPAKKLYWLLDRCSPGGIGRALALEFKRRGLRVFATARKTESIDSLAAKGIEVLSLTVDDPDSVKRCCEEVRQRLGPKEDGGNGRGLDYLVNNAGRGRPAFPFRQPRSDASFS